MVALSPSVGRRNIKGNQPSDYLLKSSTFQWAHSHWTNLILHMIDIYCGQGSALCWKNMVESVLALAERACASGLNTEALLVTWRDVKSEVSTQTPVESKRLKKLGEWVSNASERTIHSPLLLLLLVKFLPSATVTLGPPCQFHSGCFRPNCLGDTEQIINSSPLRLTLLGGAGFCICTSRLSWREPGSLTHGSDAHIRFNTHLK